eukprot:TRINITY_DN7080_c0_g1_i1.p1 TRINITY_DN7080_c0_g1~~TRINITY_DN7080_c0_g1_i1.p1  ORF type:complete len:436 (-),score=41.56 TRINITY_DN7080_c0_g1_i1:13-1224(-)
MAWNTFSPVARTTREFFDVPAMYVDALSYVFMVVYIPFIVPASWVLSKYNIAVGVLLGGLLNAVGAWVRYAGVMVPVSDMSRYYIVFAGQTVCSLAQCFILQVPPLVANSWFPVHQRALATSISALFNQLGVAIGFLVSPFILKNATENFPNLLMIVSIICSVAFVLLCLGFRSSPATPPSYSVASKAEAGDVGMKDMFKEVCTNRSFIILFFAYGINIGIFYAITTLLDQMLEPFNYLSDATGWLGFIIVVVGLAGAIIGGIVLDRTYMYKEILSITYLGTALSLIWFRFALQPNSFLNLAFACGSFGFFVTALLPISLEAAVEATYPIVTEELSAGLMMASAQVFGIILILSLSPLIHNSDGHMAAVVMTALAGFSTLILIGFKPEYKRYNEDHCRRGHST